MSYHRFWKDIDVRRPCLAPRDSRTKRMTDKQAIVFAARVASRDHHALHFDPWRALVKIATSARNVEVTG